MFGTLSILLLVGIAVALWMAALGANELARAHCRKLCSDAQLQLLDETVALQKLSLTKVVGGYAIRRRYTFEISADGTDRHAGSITFVGKRRQNYLLPLLDATSSPVAARITST